MANATDCNMNRETQQKSQNQSNFESLDKTAVSTLKVSSLYELRSITTLYRPIKLYSIYSVIQKLSSVKQIYSSYSHTSKVNYKPET